MEKQLTKIEESLKNIKAAEEAHNKLIKESINDCLAYIAETYKDQVFLISVLSFLPGFNDGEPCEVSTDAGVNFEFLVDHGIEEKLPLELIPEEYDEPEEYIDKLYNEKPKLFADPKTKEVNEFLTNILVPYAEQEYGTNFYLAIIFKDGTWEMLEIEEYWCGY